MFAFIETSHRTLARRALAALCITLGLACIASLTCASVAFSATKNTVAVPKPAKVKSLASEESTASSVSLSWRSSKDATGYRIYTASPNSSKYRQVKAVSAKPVATAKLSGLKLGTEYWFKWRPYYKTKTGTKYGSYGSKFSRRAVAFGSTSTGYITLQKDASKTVSGYILYRASSKNGSYKKVKTVVPRVTCRVSKLSASKKYRFRVQAVRRVGKKKVYAKKSARFTTYTAAVRPAKATGGAFKDKTDTSLEFSWSRVSGATGYQVCVSTTKAGSRSQTKTLSGASRTKVAITGLEPGKKYWVKVRTIKKTKRCTSYSSYTKPLSQRTLYLVAPSIETVHGGDGYVLMTWNAVSRAEEYEVQRRSQLEKKWTTIQTEEGRTTVYCEDDTMVPGITSEYRVRAKAAAGSSPWSEEAKATPLLAIPTIKALSKTTLTWYSVDNAKEYQVFKRAEGESGWKMIGSSTKTSFTIPEADQDETASFSVCAVGDYCSSRLADTSFSMKNMKHSGVSALIEGDSVVSAKSSFAKRAARKLGLDWESRAVAGSRVSDTTSDANKNIYQRSVEKGFCGYDLIVFRMGSNDYNSSVTLGEIGTFNPATFAGAYETVLNRARFDAPNAKIVVCTPLTRGEFRSGKLESCYKSKNSQGYTMDAYRNVMISLAEKYGCYVYDMKDSSVITAKNLLTTTFDRAHPNYASSITLGDEFELYLNDVVSGDQDTDTNPDDGTDPSPAPEPGDGDDGGDNTEDPLP